MKQLTTQPYPSPKKNNIEGRRRGMFEYPLPNKLYIKTFSLCLTPGGDPNRAGTMSAVPNIT